MCGSHSADTTGSNRSNAAYAAPIAISSDDARQGDAALNTLHVLGFGLAGAILGNALVLALLTWS